MPIRVQRKRTKGWRMPENTLYVGRPSRWANPFIVRQSIIIGYTSGGTGIKIMAGNNEEAVELYKKYCLPNLMKEIHLLKGMNLSCFCGLDECCHADVLLDAANQPGACITDDK